MTNNLDGAVSLLCVLLDCGYADLDMILDSKYDMYDIIGEAEEFVPEGKPTLNDLIYAMFRLGENDFFGYIDEHKDEVRESLSDEEIEEFDEMLEDTSEDFNFYCNYFDSHANLKQEKRDFYEKYFPDAIAHFEEMTDISLT